MLCEASAPGPPPDAFPRAFAEPEVFAFAEDLLEAADELAPAFAADCVESAAPPDAFTSALLLFSLVWDALALSVAPFEEDCTFADVLADAFTLELL